LEEEFLKEQSPTARVADLEYERRKVDNFRKLMSADVPAAWMRELDPAHRQYLSTVGVKHGVGPFDDSWSKYQLEYVKRVLHAMDAAIAGVLLEVPPFSERARWLRTLRRRERELVREMTDTPTSSDSRYPGSRNCTEQMVPVWMRQRVGGDDEVERPRSTGADSLPRRGDRNLYVTDALIDLYLAGRRARLGGGVESGPVGGLTQEQYEEIAGRLADYFVWKGLPPENRLFTPDESKAIESRWESIFPDVL
jgi:hypothetical protein